MSTKATTEALSFQARCDAVYAALKLKLGSPYDQIPSWCVQATYEDSVVVGRGAKYESYPYQITLFGDVTLGDPQPVEPAWAALTECRGSRILAPVVEAETESAQPKPGSKWATVLVQEGLSINRRFYTAECLRAAARLYEGKPCLRNHDTDESGMPDPSRVLGAFRNARFTTIEGADGKRVGAVTATLHLTDPATRTQLINAFEEGLPDLLGLSHTAMVREADRTLVHLTDGAAVRVDKISGVRSVDLVVFPSAGGRVLKMVAGLAHPVDVATEQELAMLETKLKRLREARPDLAAKLPATPTEAEVDALLLEAMAPQPKPADKPATEPSKVIEGVTTPATPKPDAPASQGLSDADRALLRESIEASKALAKHQRQVMVEAAIAGANLPAIAAEELREDLMARPELTAEAVTAALAKKTERVSKLLEAAGVGFGSGVGGGSIQAGTDSAQKLLDRADDLFMSDATEAAKTVYEAVFKRKLGEPENFSPRALYMDITGDTSVIGKPLASQAREASIQRMRRFGPLLEARQIPGMPVVFEAALTTGGWTYLFANTLGRRMLAEYRAADLMAQWQMLVNIVPVNDFRPQARIRWGAFGDLPVVAQQGNYTEQSVPGDEQITYSVEKRGYTASWTWEAFVNDDLGQLRMIPVKFGQAAARTITKYVLLDLIAANPTYGPDSTALFAAGHSNLSGNALSYAEIVAARKRMADQTDPASQDKLALRPKWLMVGTSNEELGVRLTQGTMSPVDPTRAATEPNWLRNAGFDTLILNPYLGSNSVGGTATTENSWFIGCDRAQAPTIEMGFLFGQQDPTIVLADAQAVDPYFVSDTVRIKIRHVWKGANVDFRTVQGYIAP